MSALKILAKLGDAGFSALSPLHRVLLVTDGTLTEILEAHFLEPIELVKLAQQIAPAAQAHAALEPAVGEKCLERKILLRGAESGRVYVYAESAIAFERLPPKLHDDLLRSPMPLGRLWREHRLETFKELLDLHRRPARELAAHFGVGAETPLLARTYCVSAGGRPVMTISEYFETV